MIRILRPWRRLKPGDQVDYGSAVNNVLIRRHIAEPCERPARGRIREKAVRKRPPENAAALTEARQ